MSFKFNQNRPRSPELCLLSLNLIDHNRHPHRSQPLLYATISFIKIGGQSSKTLRCKKKNTHARRRRADRGGFHVKIQEQTQN